MTGLVPGLSWCQTEWRRPPRSDHALVAPLSAAISQIRLPLRHTAGAVKRSVPDGVETIWSSCPLCGRVPRSRREREEPDLPVLAALCDELRA